MTTKYEEHMKRVRELLNPPITPQAGNTALEKLKEVARRGRMRK